jgi:hypothetical protein
VVETSRAIHSPYSKRAGLAIMELNGAIRRDNNRRSIGDACSGIGQIFTRLLAPHAANRRVAIESIIEADPISTCLRALMIDRTMWTGSASDLLRLCAEHVRADIPSDTPWAKNPRALAGRLRRAQTFLRTLGIEIAFSREGRTGTRMIRVSTSAEDTVSTAVLLGAFQNLPP